jgi:hypothetical protein
MIANSSAMARTLATLRALSETSGPILLVGEPGTGKDFLAGYVHVLQGRKQFVHVDCRDHEEALTKSLLGYFDDYHLDAYPWQEEGYHLPGKIEQATDGTLYLDMIDLATSGATSVLSVILVGSPYTPVGLGRLVEQSNVLVIASCQPHALEAGGTYIPKELLELFGERVVSVPKLRERLDDLIELVLCFADEEYQDVSLDITPEAQMLLAQHSWPNNLRDLRVLTGRIVTKRRYGGIVDARTVEDEFVALATDRSAPTEYLRQKRCSALARNLVYQERQIQGDEIYYWISQFEAYRSESPIDPRDIAEHLIRCVCQEYFYSDTRLKCLIDELYHILLNRLAVDLFGSRNGQLTPRMIARLKGHMVVTNPLPPMKSPDRLQLMFRSVAGLIPRAQTVEFELLSQYLGDRGEALRQGAAIVFLDDSIGTGRQFITEILPRLQADEKLRRFIQANDQGPIMFYMLVCLAYEGGLRKAKEAMEAVPWLKLSIVPHTILRSPDVAFSTDSRIFPDPAIRQEAFELIIERIGQQLSPTEEWTLAQGLVVFCHNTPNNTLAVIRKNGKVGSELWKAIFPRMRAG